MKKFLEIFVWIMALMFRYPFTIAAAGIVVIGGPLVVLFNLACWATGIWNLELFLGLLGLCILIGAVIRGNEALEWTRDHTFLAQYPGLDL